MVYSMDRPETYGPRVYTLSFAEAARRDIICGYKVIISVVTSAMVNEELLRRGEVIVQGDPVKARQVANQIALQKAVERVGVRKIITFHGTVRSAASFTSERARGFALTYRSSRLSTSTAPCGRQIATTIDARVSGGAQGRDVQRPLPDRRGGRSRRWTWWRSLRPSGAAWTSSRPPGGPCGLHRVRRPAMCSCRSIVQEAAGETVERAVDRAEFEEVWNVLQALQEQDEVLADIIREMREAQGSDRGFDDAASARKS